MYMDNSQEDVCPSDLTTCIDDTDTHTEPTVSETFYKMEDPPPPPPPPPPALMRLLQNIMDNTSTVHEQTKFAFSRTPKQTPHFNTRSEIYPSRTRVKNKIMKTLKSAQNIGNRASKCIWHCFSCDIGYLSTRLRSFTRLKVVKYFGNLC